MTIRRLLTAACLVVALTGLVSGPSNAAGAGSASGPVIVIHLNAAIDEAAAIYMHGALRDAASENAQVAVIQLDTPGGTMNSMRSIVSDILASPVPVVVWVGPSGARAASAGTFLGAASSFLAMAHATSIGAVAIVRPQGGTVPPTVATKAMRDAAALMRAISTRRHRPVTALQQTIFGGRSYSAKEAVQLFETRAYSAEKAVRLGVADLEASTLSTLLEKLDGRFLATSAGSKRVHTAGVRIEQVEASSAQRSASGPVIVVHFKTTIDELGSRFLGGALHHAANEHAQVVVIQLDTPGGSVDSMRTIVSKIFASPMPVVVWVGPSGARAASAGTFLGAASSFLAMAPATNIGAAAVVGTQGENLPSTLAKKATQDVAALMRSIAVRRHRPVAALQATIFKARAYSAEEAVQLGIADLEVPTLSALLAKLDGSTLATSAGPKTVHTTGVRIEQVKMSFWQRLLGFLSDPNLVFLLLNVGGLGLIIELWTGGNSWIPGSLGVICLLLAFAGLSVLPFSWAGLALILLGIAFLGFELHAPGHLFFGIAGTTSIILGGIFLLGYFGSPGLPGYNPSISLWLLISLAVIVGLLVLLMAREVHLSHHGERYVSAVEQKALVGQVAEVSTRLAPAGEVWVGGEAWQAELKGGGTAEPGERLKVVAVDGFRVIVEPPGKKTKENKPKKS